MSDPPQSNESPTSPTGHTSNRRRSSGLMPGFDSLQQQKRGNEANAARRQSMSDQQGKGGFLMNLFHNNFGRNAEK